MKLGIINKRNFGKFTNMWMSNNTLLDIQWVKGEITREIRKYFEMKENKDTTFQNLWNAAKAILGDKHIDINAYIKNEDKSQISYLIFDLKTLGKEEQIKSKRGRMKEVIQIRMEINEKENRKTVVKINKPKIGSLEWT